MAEQKILWVDDEIDLLRAHIIFLEQKNFIVKTATNGNDALDLVKKEYFDIIFLDENMPGLSGIETLGEIKRINSSIPIVMITKSEAENIMEEAIGASISDYLIKPVNPNQILLAIKKNVNSKQIVNEKTTQAYQTTFRNISTEINEAYTFDEWKEVYKKLIYWELKLENSEEKTMDELLLMQKKEANNSFSKFIKKNYVNWFQGNEKDRPIMSHTIFKNKIFPYLKNGEKIFVMVFDNLRYDQWKALIPFFSDYYKIDEEDITCSILPTATQYARNAMFAGLMPSEINKLYPDIWLNDEDEGNKNEHEEELLLSQLKRNNLKSTTYYDKIFNNKQGLRLIDNIKQILTNDLTTVVFNFIDIMSHARTEMQMIKELAEDESAYRSITKSWFEHSSILELLKKLSEEKIKIIITTDHGTVNVSSPIKVIGDKNTTTNLRYKHGKSLNYNEKEVFEITKPELVYLPKSNVSSRYIFTTNADFFAYPNNFNHYVKYYKNTFQHGGVSLEEMMLPFAVLSPK
jgi:DNA-binding response OmpR family regulator